MTACLALAAVLLDQVTPNTHAAPSPSTIRTSVGAIFTRIDDESFALSHPGFGISWRAPDGSVWSENHKDPETAYFNESKLVRICARMGGRLPSRADYEKLSSYFEKRHGELTERGRGDLRAVFPDVFDDTVKNRWAWRGYWTADKQAEGFYYSFDSFRGAVAPEPSEMMYKVRCLAD